VYQYGKNRQEFEMFESQFVWLTSAEIGRFLRHLLPHCQHRKHGSEGGHNDAILPMRYVYLCVLKQKYKIMLRGKSK